MFKADTLKETLQKLNYEKVDVYDEDKQYLFSLETSLGADRIIKKKFLKLPVVDYSSAKDGALMVSIAMKIYEI